MMNYYQIYKFTEELNKEKILLICITNIRKYINRFTVAVSANMILKKLYIVNCGLEDNEIIIFVYHICQLPL